VSTNRLEMLRISEIRYHRLFKTAIKEKNCEDISAKLNGQDTLMDTPPIEKDLTWLCHTLHLQFSVSRFLILW